jgi:hypothetical protein
VLSTKVNENIDLCEVVWEAEAEVTAELDAADFKEGSNSEKITIGADFGTGKVVYIERASAYSSQYPVQDTDHVKATTNYPGLTPWLTTDPTNPLTTGNTQWYSYAQTTNQRFHIDLGSAKIITRIYYENSLEAGAHTTGRGVKNFTFWGSNDGASFAELTYAVDDGWNSLVTDVSQLVRHVDAEVVDPHYVIVTNVVAYRYYAIKCEDCWDSDGYMGVRRIELQTTDAAVETDLSGYKQISFWIKNSVAVAANTLKLALCSDTEGDTIVDEFIIPAIPSVDRWVAFTIDKGSAL